MSSHQLSDNENADRQHTEMILAATQIVTSSENLLKYVNELKLARLLMDWKKQEENVDREIERYERQEKGDLAKLKRVAEEVSDLAAEVDLHINNTKVKKLRF